MTINCKFLGVQGIFLNVLLFGSFLMHMAAGQQYVYVLETASTVNACVNEETVLSVIVREAGEPVSDVYVELWIDSEDDVISLDTTTDIDGVASFSWSPTEADTFSLQYNAYYEGDDTVFIATSELFASQCLDCATAVPSKSILWPPNHKFHDITIKGVTDVDGDRVNIIITSIYSDEETATASGVGGTTHAPDASGVGTNTARLRAERSGAEPRNGRVYTIGFAATDGSGGACNGAVEVGVPHAKKDTPINDGALYDATI